MDVSKLDPETMAKTEVFAEGGEMGATMRALHRSETALGPVASWSLTLCMMVVFRWPIAFPAALVGAAVLSALERILGPRARQNTLRRWGSPPASAFRVIGDIIGPLIRYPVLWRPRWAWKFFPWNPPPRL